MTEMEKTLAQRMIGQRVTHVSLGAGVVSACTNIAMKVKLDETGEECAFAFPYSFKQFFTAEDPALQQEILDFYDSGAWVAPIHDHHDY